ncbi:hypothetical protein ECE50_030725, partial [Chitinophaga sp. Mgbs1]|nr:hypothetical protein [Chitinophaga solisilvae]
FPTYLFFSSDGKIVHRDGGMCNTDEFIRIAANALDTTKQYYTLLNKYRAGLIDSTRLLSLAVMERQTGNRKLADSIAADYSSFLLRKSNQNRLLEKENLMFISIFPELLYEMGSKSRYFELLYNQGAMIDSILGQKDFSDFYVKGIISKEEIYERLFIGNKPISRNPDWKMIRDSITGKYSKFYADLLLPQAQLVFYRQINDWYKFAQVREEQILQNPPKPGVGIEADAWRLNGDAWAIFEGCNDKSIIKRALGWIDISIKLDPSDFQILDTKANLLYKSGKVKEAIIIEKQVVEMAKSIKHYQAVEKYESVITKMKRGEPTWPVN